MLGVRVVLGIAMLLGGLALLTDFRGATDRIARSALGLLRSCDVLGPTARRDAAPSTATRTARILVRLHGGLAVAAGLALLSLSALILAGA
ncbi:hypothetical protein ABZZ20_31475 [Streptomyces sp. NPDC006430]|uniref:hypothetical protein n=1 Tax=Streptomyces sp. NPDC006430 TaxID=3154299 RepID=UPI0033B98E69